MRIALYDSEKATVPRSVDLDWGELCELLTDAPVQDSKHGPAWSPVDIDGPRRNENVKAVTALVLDVDHATEEGLRVIADRLEGISHVAHSSYSDTPGDRCVRVVIPLSRPVTAEEWPRFRPAALEVLGIRGVDASTKDLARLYFCPSQPPASSPGSNDHRVYTTGDGPHLEVDVILASAPDPPAVKNPGGISEFGKLENPEFPKASPELISHARESVNALVGKTIKPGRGAAAVRVGMILRHDYALSADEAWPLAVEWNATYVHPPIPIEGEEGLKQKIENGYKYADGERGASRDAFELSQKFKLLSSRNTTESDNSDGFVLPSEVALSPAFNRPVRSFATGLPELDTLLNGGPQSRQLTIIAAPTGSGKTGFACHLARAWHQQAPVLYVSTELDAEEMIARLAAPLIGRSVGALLAKPEPNIVHPAVRDLRIPIVAFDMFKVTRALEFIHERALKAEQKLGARPIIIVDYLQQLTDSDEEHRRLSISNVANGLRGLAQDLDTAVVAVSSVSRAYYGLGAAARAKSQKDEDPRDWLAAAKESGDIEYAAGVFAYLETSSSVNTEGIAPARLIVAKARRGRCGFVGLRFNGPTGGFQSDIEALKSLGAAAQDFKDDQVIIGLLQKHKRLKEYELRGYGIGNDRLKTVVNRLVARSTVARIQDITTTANGKIRPCEFLELSVPCPGVS